MVAVRLEDLSDTPLWLDCYDCGAWKPATAFDLDSRNTRRGGRRCECKDCRRLCRKRYRIQSHAHQIGRINAI
jgi:hypothetical protein